MQQQPSQPTPETEDTAAPVESAVGETDMVSTEAEVPMECPLSHRVARKASVTIIAVLCVLIAATVIYVLTSGGS